MADHSNPQNAPPVGTQEIPVGRQQHPLTNYQFSADELRILKECNIDSFFQRCLPFGTGLGLAAYFGVKRGFLTPNSKYGAVPKIVVSVIVGYFLGKFSYQKKCAEKLMQLPNSKLAELLKQRKRGSIYDSLTPDQGLGAGLALAPFTTPNPDMYTDEGLRSSQSTALDLDTERPTQYGLDDSQRPSLDSAVITYDDEVPIEPSKNSVSYDELRKQNREEYMKKKQNRVALPQDAAPIVRAPEKQKEETNAKKNQYGDIWSQ